MSLDARQHVYFRVRTTKTHTAQPKSVASYMQINVPHIRDTRTHLFSMLFSMLNAIIEPRCEKTGLRGFRPGPTQTGLYSHIRWLEA